MPNLNYESLKPSQDYHTLRYKDTVLEPELMHQKSERGKMYIEDLHDSSQDSRILDEDQTSIRKGRFAPAPGERSPTRGMQRANSPNDKNFHLNFLKFGLWPEPSFDKITELKREYKQGNLMASHSVLSVMGGTGEHRTVYPPSIIQSSVPRIRVLRQSAGGMFTRQNSASVMSNIH